MKQHRIFAGTRLIGLTLTGLMAAGLSATAGADVSLTGRSSVTLMNMPNQGREALYVHKHLLRRDLSERGRAYTYLYDLDKRELAVLDHALRQATVHRLDPPERGAARLDKGLVLDVKANGRHIGLQHLQCEEHALKASMPGVMGQEKVTLTLDGKVWLARQAEEAKELKPFVQGLDVDDFFLGMPDSVQGGEGQARALNAVLRRLAALGLPCAADIQVNYSGDGPMARMGQRMATRLNLNFETVSPQALVATGFEIPANYRVQRD